MRGEREREVLGVLSKTSVTGLTRLAILASGRSDNQGVVLKEYLECVLTMEKKKYLNIRQSNNSVLIRITGKGKKLVRRPLVSKRVYKYVIGLGGGLMIAGCSAVANKNSMPVSAKVEVVPAAVIEQRFDDKRRPYWTYCDKDCLEPTPKTYKDSIALEKKSMPPATKTVADGELKKKQLLPITLSADVLFDFDSSSMSSHGQEILGELGTQLAGIKKMKVEVIGYTDRIGNDAYNLGLSKKRAEAVKEEIAKVGNALSVTAEGRGKENPVSKCGNLADRKLLIKCLQPDRRVEIKVSGEKE